MSGNISRDAAVRAIMAQKWESGSDGAAALAIVAGAPAAEMQTLAERDAALEKLWEEFGDVPMNPETECMEAPFLSFPAGTFREEIWHWFDERHSKGVAYLLYGDGVDRTDQTAKMMYMKRLCFECESKDCQFNHGGECRIALVHERRPTVNDDEGCIDYDRREVEA